MQNERIAKEAEKIHMESTDKGYRRINDELRHEQQASIERYYRFTTIESIKRDIAEVIFLS